MQTTLLGLLGACSFELAILKCANRVVAHDTVDMLTDSYRHCMKPATVMYLAEQHDEGEDGFDDASGSKMSLTSPESVESLGAAAR